jgi:hypothetical protein
MRTQTTTTSATERPATVPPATLASDRPSRWRRFLTLSVFAMIVLLAGCGRSAVGPGAAAVSSAAPGIPPVSFYRIPASVTRKAPGTVFRTLRLQSPPAVRLWVVLYHSRSRTGADVIDSGVVAMPAGPVPQGGFPLVVFAHGLTGLQDADAPSRTGDTGTPLPIGGVLKATLARHWAVALPDYEGLGTPGPLQLGVGLSAGHSLLDSARAARTLVRGAVSTRVAFVGHSEGGHAALWADQLAGSYAPELHVRAVAATAPGANLPAIGQLRDYSPQTTLNVLALLGDWGLVYHAPLSAILTPAGIHAAHLVLADHGDRVNTSGRLFRPAGFHRTVWARLAAQNTPGARRTPAPILLAVGTADQQVPAASNLALAHVLRRRGDRVRLRVLRGVDHDHTFLNSWAAVLAFVRRRL